MIREYEYSVRCPRCGGWMQYWKFGKYRCTECKHEYRGEDDGRE